MLLFRGSGLLQTRYRSEKQLSSIAQPDCAAKQKTAGFSTRDPSISRTSSGAWCAGFRDEERKDAEHLRADHPRWSFAGAKSRWRCEAGSSLVAAGRRRARRKLVLLTDGYVIHFCARLMQECAPRPLEPMKTERSGTASSPRRLLCLTCEANLSSY